jgi:hypothetical protein
MDYLADIASRSLLAFGLLLFFCLLFSYALGFYLGSRRQAAHKGEAEGIGLVANGLLALLAFTLALTLAYGSERFSERRAGILTEANAIGTAWLRAKAIGLPHSLEIAERLGEYGQLRREYILAPRGSPAIQNIDQRTSALQTEIWERLATIIQERSDDVVASLMTALNDTFDATAAQRFAVEARFPTQLFWLLIGMAVISMGIFGYQLGLKGQRIHASVALLTAVWTTVFSSSI